MPRKPESQTFPHAREEGLTVQDLVNEVLVYDLDRDKAHCLNPSVARIWKLCDGKTSVPEIAKKLEGALTTPIHEDVVWVALDQLEKAHLLREKLVRPEGQPRISRRDLAKRMAVGAAVAVPFI